VILRVLSPPLCWMILSRAPLNPLFEMVEALLAVPSLLTVMASSQMYGYQTLSIVQLPRQWMPSPMFLPKITFLTEPPSATSMIGLVLD